MEKKINLTEGNILSILIKLAIPIMGTSFIQTAYSLVNMIYLGRLNSRAVAAVGTASFFMWLANSIIFIPKTGAEIGVSQSIGRRNKSHVKAYIKNTVQLDIILGLLYALTLIIFRKELIDFFRLGDSYVFKMATTYLLIQALFMNFYFINPVLTGIFNGYGDSRTPFKINTVGLIINMILDPIFIFGLGPFPRMEVVGAAISTVIAQIIVTGIFLYKIKKLNFFKDVNLFKKPDWKFIRNIFKFGLPVALQNGLFCIFAMIIARIIAGFGEIPIAVQKVGSQIESLSWMTADGFAIAVSAFVGQNYGAEKWDRIKKGYFTALFIVSIIGVSVSALLIFAGGPVFSLFIPDKQVIPYGRDYLRILGYSQLFMCLEITTSGAFNGLGKTIPPAIIGIIFTGARVPAAIYLSQPHRLGLNGVWWSISISSIFKGVVLTTIFIVYLKKRYQQNNQLMLKKVSI